LIKERGATFIALNNYMIPGLGVLWGFLFLNEQVSTQEIIALAVILTGIGVASIRKRSGP